MAHSGLTKRLMLSGLLLGAVALFALVDVPQTVRIKALIINSLPLEIQTKHDAVASLCRAAAAGSGRPNDSALNCVLANDITAAENLKAFNNRLDQIIRGSTGLQQTH